MSRSTALFLIPITCCIVLLSCDDDVIDPPCADWWVGIELDEGVEWLDADDDGEPEGITYVDGDEIITVVCDDSDDDDCIPDCLTEYMDGIDDTEEDGEVDDVDGDDEVDVDDGDGGDDEPCGDWWLMVDWIDGVELVDLNGDGIPDVLQYIDGDELITVTCDGDLDGDCIPDCFEEFLF